MINDGRLVFIRLKLTTMINNGGFVFIRLKLTTIINDVGLVFYQAKAQYAQSLRNLEEISESIHER